MLGLVSRVHPIDLSLLRPLLAILSRFDVLHTFYGGAAFSTLGLDLASWTQTANRGRLGPIHVNHIAGMVPLLDAHRDTDWVLVDSQVGHVLLISTLRRDGGGAVSRLELPHT